MKNVLFLLLLAALGSGCQKKTESTAEADDPGNAEVSADSIAVVGKPKPLFTLPDKYNTPDGMALAPNGDIILSVPNLADNDYPGVLLKITEDTIAYFTRLPAHPETKHACPMDLAFGPDGHLYYADNQYENDKNYKSRLMRIRMRDGAPTAVEPVVTGFGLSNAVVWKDNNLYVSDSQWDMPDDDHGSAVFRFTLAELQGAVVQLKPRTRDPHLLTTFTTQVNETGVDNGADGLDFDSQGNLFTGSFGDGTMYKMRLNRDGSLATREVFRVDKKFPCVDGLVIDRKNDLIYVCDSRMNAIRVVTPEGKVSVLAQNGDTDGRDGLLDQPAEVLLKKNRLYVVNFDKPEKNFVNTKSDAPHTLSVIDLPPQKE